MSLQELPIEILSLILTQDLKTFTSALKVPWLGTQACCEWVQREAKAKFVSIRIGEHYTHYRLDGLYHRIDGPAIIEPGVWEMWCRFGLAHRKDGPAIIHSSGGLEWCIKGERHREDGPAAIFSYKKEWWINGNYHRIGGPAYEGCDLKAWFENGKLHRLNGPAYESGNEKLWYIDHEQVSPLAVLPIEVLSLILTQDLETFLSALKVPWLGTQACCEYVQREIKAKWGKVLGLHK